jgi:hypothetical protein
MVDLLDGQVEYFDWRAECPVGVEYHLMRGLFVDAQFHQDQAHGVQAAVVVRPRLRITFRSGSSV